MQEEVENRTVNLAISTTKLTARSIVSLGLKGIAYIKRKSQEAAIKNEKPTGKQTIQELIGQNQGVTNIDISKTDLKGFEKYARKYGVDYAITKDKSVLPPKYLVFFKARDADAMTAARLSLRIKPFPYHMIPPYSYPLKRPTNTIQKRIYGISTG